MRLIRRLVVVSFLGFVGCSSPGLRQVSEVVGLSDAVLPAAVSVDVVCDGSGRACSPDRLRAVLDWVLVDVAERPGSELRLFALGNDLGSTLLLGTVSSFASPRPGVAAVRAHHEVFRATAVSQLLTAATPIWRMQHRASPIAEVVAAASAYPSQGIRVVVLLSDLWQESPLGHQECDPLPTAAQWTARTKGLFARLKGSTVIVAYASPLEPVDNRRCPNTNKRYDQLVAIWTQAVTASGARISIYPDAIPQSLRSLLGGDQ